MLPPVVPFPVHGPMPVGWSWGTLYGFFQAQLERMREHCNRKHETTDSVQTLLLEGIIQFLSPVDNVFRLPWVIWNRHPLGVFIGAEDTEGRCAQDSQLRARQHLPSTIAEQHLFEARIENFARSEFDEGNFARIRDEAAALLIPKDLWDLSSQIAEELVMPI